LKERFTVGLTGISCDKRFFESVTGPAAVLSVTGLTNTFKLFPLMSPLIPVLVVFVGIVLVEFLAAGDAGYGKSTKKPRALARG